MSDSLRPHGLQHARLPCPSLSSWICLKSCPLSWWCHPTISSSVTSFSNCPQSFLALVFSKLALWIRWPKYWHFSFSVSPFSEYSGLISFRITGLISLLSRNSQESSPVSQFKYQFFGTQPSLWSNSHIHTCLEEKLQLWLYGPLSAKWRLCFLIHCLGLGRSPGGGHGNPLQYSCQENPHGQRSLAGYSPWGHKESDTTEWVSTAQHRFGIAFLPRSKCLLISWLQSPSTAFYVTSLILWFHPSSLVLKNMIFE